MFLSGNLQSRWNALPQLLFDYLLRLLHRQHHQKAELSTPGRIHTRVSGNHQMPESAEDAALVLVVDDEPLIQELVATSLQEAGFGIVLAPDGKQASAYLENEPVRVVVTDVDLKGKLTGWDVARRARELRPDIPVIYMTGAHADEWTAMGVPQSLLIAKPFAPAQMVTAVSQLLNAAGCRAARPDGLS
jgi:CheY-like chemotaxis protein